jgi:putative acetyltransferase
MSSRRSRRRGIARKMLAEAEGAARRMGCALMVLSTSELQTAALALYQNAGYRLVREEIASELSNKTVGGGLRRFWFEKRL